MTRIFAADKYMLVAADYRQPEFHKHLAQHIIFSLEGTMVCQTSEMSKVECRGIVIDGETLHTVDGFGREMLVFILDDTTDLAEQINEKYLCNESSRVLSDILCDQITTMWKTLSIQDVLRFCRQCFNLLGISEKNTTVSDQRIAGALLQILRMKEISETTILKLSNSCCLSQSRFSHLFKKQTGISLNSYLVLSKLRKAYYYLSLGHNITTAALEAGFSSSSHFAATSKTMLGLTGSDVRKNWEWMNLKT